MIVFIVIGVLIAVAVADRTLATPRSIQASIFAKNIAHEPGQNLEVYEVYLQEQDGSKQKYEVQEHEYNQLEIGKSLKLTFLQGRVLGTHYRLRMESNQ